MQFDPSEFSTPEYDKKLLESGMIDVDSIWSAAEQIAKRIDREAIKTILEQSKCPTPDVKSNSF